METINTEFAMIAAVAALLVGVGIFIYRRVKASK